MVHKCTNDADVNYLGCTLSFPSFLYLPQLLDHLEMHRQADSSSGISILANYNSFNNLRCKKLKWYAIKIRKFPISPHVLRPAKSNKIRNAASRNAVL